MTSGNSTVNVAALASHLTLGVAQVEVLLIGVTTPICRRSAYSDVRDSPATGLSAFIFSVSQPSTRTEIDKTPECCIIETVREYYPSTPCPGLNPADLGGSVSDQLAIDSTGVRAHITLHRTSI